MDCIIGPHGKYQSAIAQTPISCSQIETDPPSPIFGTSNSRGFSFVVKVRDDRRCESGTGDMKFRLSRCTVGLGGTR